MQITGDKMRTTLFARACDVVSPGPPRCHNLLTRDMASCHGSGLFSIEREMADANEDWISIEFRIVRGEA
ncbi:hypothetical protein NL676_011911 [Syzygium grande]|nr:hypothetical protein NL676_011911 [Syzygium grande]